MPGTSTSIPAGAASRPIRATSFMTAQLFFLRAAAVLGFSAVALGAFGAHALKQRLAPDLLEIFEVGVRYQYYHTVAILACALAPAVYWESRWLPAANGAWLVGVLIFSGSLYALAFSGVRWLGAVTPLGGVAFLIGWALLFIAAGAAAPRG